MKLPHSILLTCVSLVAASSLLGAEITGKVRDVSGDTVMVEFEGEARPAVGDSAEIFFTLAGAEVSVASGKVEAVEAKVVKVKIEKAPGSVAKDHLVRIKPESGATALPTPSPASSSSGTGATSSVIVGDWVGTFGDDTDISFSFKADGTFLWVVEDAQYAKSTRAKYRIDLATQPHRIEFFDIEEGEQKDELSPGIFAVQGDGRLQLEFPKGPEAPPLKEFTKEALLFAKATSPVVRPNKPPPPAPPTPTPYVAPTPTPDEVLVREAVQAHEREDYAAAIRAAEKAIELNPKNARAFLRRGLARFRMQNPTGAIADFEKAMELDPSNDLKDLIRNIKAGMETTQPTTPTPERSRAKTKRKP